MPYKNVETPDDNIMALEASTFELIGGTPADVF